MAAAKPKDNGRQLAKQLRSREDQPEDNFDMQRLVHELETHQAELEMQNDELRRARHEVETVLDRYRALFEFAPIGYFLVDADGRIREVNHVGAELLQQDKSALAGRHFFRSVSTEQQAAFGAFLRAVLAGHAGGQRFDISLGQDPDERREIRLTASRIAGSPPAALLAVVDVTVAKRAETALRDADRRKDEFLAVLSHELRNPLAPMRNALALLARIPSDSERGGHALAVIDRQVTHLTRMVDDLLDVTRITRGSISLQMEQVELGQLVRHVVADYASGFASKRVRLEPELPVEPLWVRGDTARLVQVLGNFLGNALKFTESGDEVVIGARREGHAARLYVRDTGVGLAPELQSHLFEPFVQGAQTLDRNPGGLGLGLAMAKGLIELHGGTIEAHSEGSGCGSEFAAELPLVAAPTSLPEVTHARQQERRRVLVIEDQTDAAETLRAALELEGHDVQIASNGDAGLQCARQVHPDVVLCDIGLPHMNGYEVAQAFRHDRMLSDIYLVAVTGYALPRDVQHAIEAGFDRHIAKPLDLTRLGEIIAAAPSAGHHHAV